MKQLDPLQATERLHQSYSRYLKTLYPINDEELSGQFSRLLSDEKLLIKGPYLEATPPYRQGRSIQDLISEELLSPLFSALDGESLPLERTLYLHQEEAIRKLVNRRNLIIATGTGSGKTEAFIIPILHHLLEQERRSELGPGVRAMLLYPMNALANDQMKRLRAILKNWRFITFGRYTGETKKKKRDAEEDFQRNMRGQPRIENELLSREEMWRSPPHILLTNYAMLEYLLLRPDDSVFFDGPHACHWKFLVLDEVHTYDGAKGIETAMLLRRLKDRIVRSERGRVTCIGTSATLGGGRKDFCAVAEFGKQLFDELFEWNDEDPNKQDVVEASRLALEDYPPCWGSFGPEFYQAAWSLIASGKSSVSKISRLASEHRAPQEVLREAERSSSSVNHFLYEILKGDHNLAMLRRKLSVKAAESESQGGEFENSQSTSSVKEGPNPMLLKDAARVVFRDAGDSEEALIALISLAAQAKPASEHAALLPARYHLFIKALEGGFASFAPEKRLYLNRRKLDDGGQARLFEIGICKRCGAVHLVGIDKPDEGGHRRLEQSQNLTEENQENAKFFFLKEESLDAPDEDEEVAEAEEVEDVEDEKEQPWQLCLRCGAIDKQGARQSLCLCDEKWTRTVLKVSNDKGTVTRCRSCGARSRSLVHRFLTGQDAPASVLATSLFQEIPEREVEPSNADEDDEYCDSAQPKQARRLLIFSDSRQDAAYFAPYLGDISYLPILWRRLMILTLQKHVEKCRENEWQIGDLARSLCNEAEDHGVFLEESRQQREEEAWKWAMLELIAQDRRNSLEGLGLVRFSLAKPARWSPGSTLRAMLANPPFDLNDDEIWELTQILIDSFRLQSAIMFPDNVKPDGDLFKPRNRAYYFRNEKAIPRKGVYSWISPRQGAGNRRLDFVQKLLARCAPSIDHRNEAQKILGLFWTNVIRDASSPLRQHFSDRSIQDKGTVVQLRHNVWEICPAFDSSDAAWFECDTCGNVFSRHLRGVCPTFRCQGTLRQCDPAQARRDNHYRQLYLNLEPMRMICREHTAQLTGAAAGELQNKFVRGEVNIISCSTTFELGVDVGSLESVLMRNVPPSPANYIQRAGRAGRRTDSTAFALTFCQRRSHDLSHFKEPERMISGTIRPPYFEVRNRKIIRRHIHSVALALFWREHPALFREVSDFYFSVEGREMKSGEEFFASHPLREFLDRRPRELKGSLKRILREQHSNFEIETWGWLEDFFFHSDTALQKAADEVYGDVEDLEKYRLQLLNDRKPADYILRTIETIKKKYLIDFLSSRGVLPKYGFPVDVVELHLLHHGKDAENLELQRDMRIALSEYAPGSQIVADGRLWTSYGLKRRHGREWLEYRYAICSNCHCYQKALADTEELTVCRNCERSLGGKDKGRFIIPEFGFVSSSDKPGRPAETRPERTYTTQIYYTGEGAEQGSPLFIKFGDIGLQVKALSGGKFAVLNRAGFKVCFSCGFAQRADRRTGTHDNPRGGKCRGVLKSGLHLGHEFQTDLLRLDFQGHSAPSDFWLSLLYALLEGASESLSVIRSDLDGCLYPHKASPFPSLVLFDNVPGGAGHTRRLADGEGTVRAMLRAALNKVADCECGEETSCYGCLQNYGNQRFHDDLRRAVARDFLAIIVT